jgi:hypothetical protein
MGAARQLVCVGPPTPFKGIRIRERGDAAHSVSLLTSPAHSARELIVDKAT